MSLALAWQGVADSEPPAIMENPFYA